MNEPSKTPTAPPPADQSAPEPVPAEPKATRRRFTPEERIAARKAEIEKIEEKQRMAVLDLIDEIAESLREAEARAALAGMKDEAKQCAVAFATLNNPPLAD